MLRLRFRNQAWSFNESRLTNCSSLLSERAASRATDKAKTRSHRDTIRSYFSNLAWVSTIGPSQGPTRLFFLFQVHAREDNTFHRKLSTRRPAKDSLPIHRVAAKASSRKLKGCWGIKRAGHSNPALLVRVTFSSCLGLQRQTGIPIPTFGCQYRQGWVTSSSVGTSRSSSSRMSAVLLALHSQATIVVLRFDCLWVILVSQASHSSTTCSGYHL